MRIPASLVPLVPVALLLAAATNAAPNAPSGRVLIDFAPGSGAAVRDAVLVGHGRVHYQFDRIDALAVSVDEALRMLTIWSARAQGEDAVKGSEKP